LDRSKEQGGAELLCCGCDVKRKVRQISENEWIVLEKGQKDHGGHQPKYRRVYTWSSTQTAVLDKEFDKSRQFTAQYLLQRLVEAGVAGACTIDDVKAKCAAERKKLGRWDKKGPP
jgi:hypothetical protein